VGEEEDFYLEENMENLKYQAQIMSELHPKNKMFQTVGEMATLLKQSKGIYEHPECGGMQEVITQRKRISLILNLICHAFILCSNTH
jgi:TPP-dependent indolepyruvate ferredoxin oxidoreductase alpha subunit